MSSSVDYYDIEIYNYSSGFIRENAEIMAKYLMGTDQGDVKRLCEEVVYYEYNGANVQTFKNTTLDAGIWENVEYSTKPSGENIVVKIGDLYWNPVFLSETWDDVILTLMLSDYQPEFYYEKGISSTLGTVGIGTINGFAFCASNTLLRADDYSGTKFTNGTNVDFNLEELQGFNSVFGEFMVRMWGEGLVTPQSIPWQQEQSAKEILGMAYNLSNESCLTTTSDSGFYSHENNYANISGSNSWASSGIWLPSLSEIGYSGVSGLWGLSDADRSSAINLMTRSANYKQSYGYYFVKSSGNGKGIGILQEMAIRPCIHLSLYDMSDGWY